MDPKIYLLMLLIAFLSVLYHAGKPQDAIKAESA
jgi:hypothetical protein